MILTWCFTLVPFTTTPSFRATTVREWLVGDTMITVISSDKAETIAREKEHSYENEKGQQVKWQFVRLIEIIEMIDQRLEDGVEIKSTINPPPAP
jgi:hypothetical protein